MHIKTLYIFSCVFVLLGISWVLPQEDIAENRIPERTKIALREVGNLLLLSQKDSTSLIAPVKQLDASTYELSFGTKLTILPKTLVDAVRESFQKADLPTNCIVEVRSCTDTEVAYSFKIHAKKEKTIVACALRELPLQCYQIEVKFLEKPSAISVAQTSLVVAAGILLLFVGFRSCLPNRQVREKRKETTPQIHSSSYTSLGSFRFYPEQNMLVKEAQELPLSKKECELLAIFVAQPNEVIKREDLTKRVWEDNGVIVGRSLDTYISKLRKKLSADTSLKITNIHGVGYKLEISK